MRGGGFGSFGAALSRAAGSAVRECLGLGRGERLLILTNPGLEVRSIAEALYAAALEVQGIPVLLVTPRKSQMDFAEPAVWAALGTRPEAFVSLTEDRIGRDPRGTEKPYQAGGRSYDNLLRYLLYGERCLRAFWSPSVTRRIFARTVPIDYALLRRRCEGLKRLLDAAVLLRLDSPAGTRLELGVRGRVARADDGDFTRRGLGGNLPAGEVFVSPQLGTASGTLVIDGSMAAAEGAIRVRRPIRLELSDGFITRIQGGSEAATLQQSISGAEARSRDMERQGRLPAGMGETYARNARGIGELGIGLNPRARIEGNVLNDEKVFGTCHLAVGFNFDEDAPTLIHLDGLVRRPTLTAILSDGQERPIMREGLFAAE